MIRKCEGTSRSRTWYALFSWKGHEYVTDQFLLRADNFTEANQRAKKFIPKLNKTTGGEYKYQLDGVWPAVTSFYKKEPDRE